MRINLCIAAWLAVVWAKPVQGQQLRRLVWQEPTYAVTAFETGDGRSIAKQLPLLSFEINRQPVTTSQADARQVVDGRLQVTARPEADFTKGVKVAVTFRNVSADTLRLSNVVPFGRGDDRVYITGLGDHPLSRTHIFRPGLKPVNCIVPDNAWELGYSGIALADGLNLCALTRRDRAGIKNGLRRRFETVLYPRNGEVTYFLYADLYRGDWQEGLRRMFQERHLYDLDPFPDDLFRRKDLEWIRHSYVMHLVMTWNHIYYDYKTGKFGLEKFLEKGRRLYGGDDVIGIWPTWPTLGLDQRNQFDLFRDLPGGTAGIRELQTMMNRQFGTKLFVCYNPWDESTRSEGHLVGLERILRETGADGVVLDTRGESSRELQETADRVKPGVVMYSEGMAVPKDMPGIVSGRVHNALYYPPMLNLNKFIKPEFAIFRVAELYKEPIRREFAVSFFNGYGTELNLFPAGLPAWLDEQYRYLGKTTRILRENTASFTAGTLTPLIPTRADGMYVNRWGLSDKVVYTVFSLLPEGFKEPLFEVENRPGYHFVDVWHHEEVTPVEQNGRFWITSRTHGFDKADLGTNNEGEVDCIVQLPERLAVSLDNDLLQVALVGQPAAGEAEIRIWAGEPDYEKQPVIRKPGNHRLALLDLFGRYEGKFVIQLFENGLLADERVVNLPAGTPRLASRVPETAPASKAPAGMVKIPAGSFTLKITNGDKFISYPKFNDGRAYTLPAFWMDRHPVTNADYLAFVRATGYQPADTANYLKHWADGRPPAGQENFPVVYVGYEDAQAYARWAGKRLPTEVEWQYAAQTPDGREWPWSKQTKGIRREIEPVNETLSVYRIKGIDPQYTNLGNGTPDPVGRYPKGTNPYGLQDLVGSVWQLTNDLYESGSYRYVIMKGGSYFNPSSSWWYVQGGPRELHYRQFLLRVSPGFERNATVGFRCMKPAL
ncbi:formylglycine-generating enzyme family protein [Larkinella soli]|uniref:formylglycine-generating enzyme family protein n=1 Tax=Larkinella soli TaxID=1770527 RepID=UPI000FFB0932|nr:SUMF1/EgtB/PvdO family nonheme iron enzyme [Larkinella soli]